MRRTPPGFNPPFDPRPRPRGFTLIEATFVLFAIAILLTIALPAWSRARAAAHAGSVRAELAATIIDAVRHATAAGTEVVVCPTGGSGQCSGQTNWDKGWMAFADTDGDRRRGADETLIEQAGAIDDSVHLRSTRGRTRLLFQPNGGNAGSNVTFTLCDARGSDYATTLVLSNGGNLHAGRASEAAARNCASGG